MIIGQLQIYLIFRRGRHRTEVGHNKPGVRDGLVSNWRLRNAGARCLRGADVAGDRV